MKKVLIVAALFLTGTGWVAAQDFKLSKSTGKLDIDEVNNVEIEGYNGSEIVFSSVDHGRDEDGRAKGLRAVSSSGFEDNTGLGISVIDKGVTIEVRQLKKMDGPRIKIMVPKGVSISYVHTSPHGSEVKFKNVEGDIEVSTVHNGVQLDNVTGAVSVRTVHGEIDAVFTAQPKSGISISSDHAHVDVSLPVSTKANLTMATSFGEIFVDPDFKIEIDRTGSMVRYSDKVNGKINGGGVDVKLSSTHHNVYLRKK